MKEVEKLNRILKKLAGGDLRSDGKSDEVAEEVIQNPGLLMDLIEGLESPDKVVRMRTAHALEVISRTNPEIIEEIKKQLISSAYKDKLPEVRWHLAQIFGNISLSNKERDDVVSILFSYLEGESILVKAWSIATLGILGKRDKNIRGKIVEKIKSLQKDKSPAVRHRVIRALEALRK